MENELIERIKLKESQAKKRALAFTFLPFFAGLLFIAYTSNKIIQSEKKLETANNEFNKVKLKNDSLNIQNDSLSKILTQSIITLGKAVSVTSEFKQFIDKMKPELRSQGEASFFVNFKMLEDKIRGDYEYLSERMYKLPRLEENKIWVVIVESSLSLEDLKKEATQLVSIYGKEQVAIFKDVKGNYALSIKGNGTFTRAYRLNVELRDKYHFGGAYFSNSNDWGIDYLTSIN